MVLLEWTAGGVTTALVIDVAEREGYESTAETTDHAVETGASISDHVRPGNDTFTIEGLISNSPIVVPTRATPGVTGGVRNANVTIGSQRFTASTLQWDAPFDRARSCDALFLALKNTGQLLRYTGSLRQAENLVLTRYRVDRDASNGNDLPVTLELKQVRLVTTQRVTVPQAAQRRGQTRQQRGNAPPAAPATPAQNTSLGQDMLNAANAYRSGH